MHCPRLAAEPARHPRRSLAAARRSLCGLVFAAMAGTCAAGATAAEGTTPPAADDVAPSVSFQTRSLIGQVVWLAEALRTRYGIESDADSAESQTVLVTAKGELWPLVKEFRGRAFWTDPRLRHRDVELFVRQYAGSDFVQVIRVYSLHEEKKYELDYWCDICAIPMYEVKPCECCQGETRLRERLVEDPPLSAPASPDSTLRQE